MTFKELQRQVYDLLGVTVPPWPLQVRAKALINQAYMRFTAESHLRSEVASVAFVPGDPFIQVPADFLEVRSIRVDGTVLRLAADSELADLHATMFTGGDGGGGPRVWVLMGPGNIALWPAPGSGVSEIELVYTAVTPEMSDDSDVPSDLPVPWHPLLAWAAVAELAVSDSAKAAAASKVQEIRGGLVAHVASRGGDDSSRIKLRGYPGRE